MVYEIEVGYELHRLGKSIARNGLIFCALVEEIGIVGVHRRFELVMRNAVQVVVRVGIYLFKQRFELLPSHRLFGAEQSVYLALVQSLLVYDLVEKRFIVYQSKRSQIFGESVQFRPVGFAERFVAAVEIVFVYRLRPKFAQFLLRNVVRDIFELAVFNPLEKIVIGHKKHIGQTHRSLFKRIHIGLRTLSRIRHYYIGIFVHKLIYERLVVVELLGIAPPEKLNRGFSAAYAGVVVLLLYHRSAPEQTQSECNGNNRSQRLSHNFTLLQTLSFFVLAKFYT